LYWAWMDNRAFRDDRWKIVWDQNVGRWELYDMDHDRGEMNDLAVKEPQRVDRMAEEWNIWATRTGATKRLGNRIQLSP
jgi:arylsulfatase A-like enzyme